MKTGKQKALKALLILAGVLALCMFFARTVQTITTAKIRKITTTRGRLEDQINLTGEVYFSASEPVFIQDAKTLAMSIDKVLVREGYYVKEGDELFRASVPGYDEKMKSLKASYETKVRELAEEVSAHLRLKQTSEHNELYNRTIQSADDYYTKRFEAYAAAVLADYELTGDPPDWGENPFPTPTPRPARRGSATPEPTPEPTPAPGTGAPDSVKQAMQAAFDAWVAMETNKENLRKVYVGGGPVARTGDAVFDYIKKVDGMREAVDKIMAEMLELEQLAAGLRSIRAPREAYVTQFSLKEGDSYDGAKPAYAISLDNERPVLRCDITDVKKTIQKGMAVSIEGLRNDLQVTDIQLAANSSKYALITLDDEALASLGGLSSLIGKQTPVTITYKAQKTTTLLPASAVRTDSDGSAYVYTVQQQWGGMLGNSGLTLQKQPITVLERSDRLVSISDDLSYLEIADREDRPIAENQTVMEYVD